MSDPAQVLQSMVDTIVYGDCLAGLRSLPDDCVDVVVTSPPYWGQREGLGLGGESDPREYVANLAEVLAEALRCLKPSGTLWLNIGDAYNTPINWRPDDFKYSSLGPDRTGLPPENSAYTKQRGRRRAFIDSGEAWLQYGNLLGIPYRVLFALADRGFLLRGEVIWRKARPMPEGRARRPHRHHEGIYILAKDERHRFRTTPPVPSVWDLRQTPNRTAHDSAFPIDLPVQCIAAADIDGAGVVLDPFMGSGTTAIAAMMLGHHFIGFEIDERMHEIACERIAEPLQGTMSLSASGSLGDRVQSELIGLRR